MKVLEIALKDMKSAFRSMFAVVMMLVMPLLITGLFYFAFGGLSNRVSVPVTQVQVANLDRPDSQTGFSAGASLLKLLQDPTLADVLKISIAPDEASARAAVNDRKAGIALVIPANFTATAMAANTGTSILLYHDPTLSLGPGIVKSVVGQFVDSVSGSRAAAAVVVEQATGRNISPAPGELQVVGMQYAGWAQNFDRSSLVNVQGPPTLTGKTSQSNMSIIGLVMAGMMLFFVFFTGVDSAETIVKEDEQGTLPRLFTTPTNRAVILGGKFVASFIILIVQLVVLLVSSSLLFGINWGEPLPVILMVLSTIVASAGFGLLIMSFVKNTRQTGAIVGGVMTLTGMAGGLFTSAFQNMSGAFEVLNLFTPQGWALRGWKLVMAQESWDQILVPVLALLVFGIGLFTVGALVFRGRFA